MTRRSYVGLLVGLSVLLGGCTTLETRQGAGGDNMASAGSRGSADLSQVDPFAPLASVNPFPKSAAAYSGQSHQDVLASGDLQYTDPFTTPSLISPRSTHTAASSGDQIADNLEGFSSLK